MTTPSESNGPPKNRRRLGKGLNALLAASETIESKQNTIKQNKTPPTTAVLASEEGAAAGDSEPGPGSASGSLREISVGLIDPSPFQPRREFAPAELRGLADSIRQSGLIQPILIRPAAGGRYELVAGERRLRASKLAGLGTIPAVVRELTDEQAAERALVENIQRTDLNPIERASALRSLCGTFGLTQQEVAGRVGLERSTVTNLVRLLDLPESVQAMIVAGDLSAGHGRALLAVRDPGEAAETARKAIAEAWSVRRTEREVAESGSPARQAEGAAGERDQTPEPDHNISDLETRLGAYLGTRIRIVHAGGKGKIEIAFFDLDHFDGLMERMGFASDEHVVG